LTALGQAKPPRKGEFYFSWGYNTEAYTRSNVKVKQAELGNDYTFEKVQAHDHKGWDEGLFKHALTIPQYNYRIGYFFDRIKGLGFEINFDHTKYIITEERMLRMKGRFEGRQVDTSVLFSKSNGFYYYLNNGANFFLFNFVKRWRPWQTKDGNLKVDILGKAGIGPVVPHVENSLFGKLNDQGFQFGGWNVGIEGTVKVTFYKYVFLEYCNKLDYASYSGLKVYKGKARQSFGTYEQILNLGITFPMGKRVAPSGTSAK
jgi:hypothetical protein